MLPVLIKIGPITIYSYGLMLALAFILAGVVTYLELKRRGYDTDMLYDLIILAAVGGIVGARIFYVIGHWADYSDNILQAFEIQSGGLIFYGGFLGGTLAILIYIWRKSLNTWEIGDIAAPALAVGAAVGRIGCFLNGCCYGQVTNVAWAVKYLDLFRHPTQIYEFFMNMIIFFVLWSYRKKAKYDGQIFWMFVFMYSIARFVVEFFRVTIPVALSLSGSQIISLILFFMSGIYLVIRSRRAREEA